MTSTLHQKILADRWYRFDRYEIKGGYICPAPGARLISYEPWKNYRAIAGKASIKQPYEPLLKLAAKLELASLGWPLRLKGDGEEEVLNWCSQYGLLGTLLHRVETVVLPPEARLKPTSKSKWPALPSPVYTIFTRTNSGWAVKEQFAGSDSSTKPGVILRRSLSDVELILEPLSATWGSYFPEVPLDGLDTYQYPIPFTSDFWKQYAEPLTDFYNAATTLREAVDQLQLVRGRSKLSEKDMVAVMKGETTVNALGAPARQMLYASGKKGYGFGWACHSLLAAFSTMVMLDVSRAGLRECKNKTCRSLFVSNAAQVKYCSPTCRGSVQMRKWRRRIARGEQHQAKNLRP